MTDFRFVVLSTESGRCVVDPRICQIRLDRLSTQVVHSPKHPNEQRSLGVWHSVEASALRVLHQLLIAARFLYGRLKYFILILTRVHQLLTYRYDFAFDHEKRLRCARSIVLNLGTRVDSSLIMHHDGCGTLTVSDCLRSCPLFLLHVCLSQLHETNPPN